MKKNYEAPRLISHGTVSEITAYSYDSTRTDTFFGAPAQVPANGLGSIDACLTPDAVQCQQ